MASVSSTAYTLMLLDPGVEEHVLALMAVPPQWSSIPIMAKELVPIIISCALWGSQLTRHTVLL